jgi:hypothetical protein
MIAVHQLPINSPRIVSERWLAQGAPARGDQPTDLRSPEHPGNSKSGSAVSTRQVPTWSGAEIGAYAIDRLPSDSASAFDAPTARQNVTRTTRVQIPDTQSVAVLQNQRATRCPGHRRQRGLLRRCSEPPNSDASSPTRSRTTSALERTSRSRKTRPIAGRPPRHPEDRSW